MNLLSLFALRAVSGKRIRRLHDFGFGLGLFFVFSSTGAWAGSLTVLRHFDLFTEGGNPSVSETLTLSGDTLFGATYSGGLNGANGAAGTGTLFSVKTNGEDFSVIHAFSSLTEDGTNAGGASPVCTLKRVGDTLYGTAMAGGSLGNGLLFSVNPDGTDFTARFNFSGAPLNTSYAKHSPFGELVLAGEILYGVTAFGGHPDADNASVYGRIFAFDLDGSITIPHAFGPFTWDGDHLYSPYGPGGGLVLLNGKLYGTTFSGGYENYGTVFTVNADGSDYTTLHYFMNADGATPRGSLILSGETLYGVTQYGGSNDRGVVFAINIDGSEFTVLHTFTYPEGTQSALILVGDTLYGTTLYGGSHSNGTIFSLKTDGTDYTELHAFNRYVDGSAPGRLIEAGGVLYGMTSNGGSYDRGTVFRLTLDLVQPPLVVFRTVNGLAADGSEDLLTPAGDGVSNLLKYAFNLIGDGPGQEPTLAIPNHSTLDVAGASGMPAFGTDAGGRLQLIYIRRKAASAPGITCTVEFSGTLSEGSWGADVSATESVTSIDSDFERVTVTESVGNAGKRFGRVRVDVL